MKPVTVAIRDQILAELQRFPGRKLSTQEVVDRVAPVPGWRHYSQVYPNLRALARAGVIEHHPSGAGERRAFWSCATWPENEELLEALWEASTDG